MPYKRLNMHIVQAKQDFDPLKILNIANSPIGISKTPNKREYSAFEYIYNLFIIN